MTDLEVQRGQLPDAALTVNTLLQSSDVDFVELAHTLSVEDLMDAGRFLTGVTRVSSVRVGQVAYEIRTQTPDGQWGRKVYELAEQWEVSERTIQRWMRGAQEHFGLELTPAQRNAEHAAPVDAASGGEDAPGEEFSWDDVDDDDDPFAGTPLLDSMNDEAGWADRDLPSAAYVNVEAPKVTPNPQLLPPDDTWVAFTVAQIQAEHEGYGDVAAERSAKARWARKLEEEPLDLLEELELIYESAGVALPDETAAKLVEAEENRPLVPDEVTPPAGEKKKRGGKQGPKLAYSRAEKMLAETRNLHEYAFVGRREGTVPDKEIAAMLPHLEGIPYTLKGLIELAKEARERVLSGMSAEERIAETRAAEAAAAAEEAEEDEGDIYSD